MSKQSRRKILKSIAVGSGAIVAGNSLPEGWTKPVVDAIILPSHAQTTCSPCLDAATYCEGSGAGSPQISVAADGTVTLTHTNGTATDTVDPCAGGDYVLEVTSPAGATISFVGSIPCGVTDSIVATHTDGTGTSQMTLSKALCS